MRCIDVCFRLAKTFDLIELVDRFFCFLLSKFFSVVVSIGNIGNLIGLYLHIASGLDVPFSFSWG